MRLLVLGVIIAMLSFSAIAMLENVVFLGSWQNNATLFSNPYYMENGSVWGKDVFKINDTVIRVKVCTNETATKKKNVCVKINTTEIHNLTLPRVKCTRLNDGNGTISCQNITYIQKTKMRHVCSVAYINTTKEKCKYNNTGIPALCINPNGSSSNTLELRNFKMSVNNGSWQDIPYIEQKLNFSNSTLAFKVDIPQICYPEYEINKAIVVED